MPEKFKLQKEILNLSKASEWESARKEWQLNTIWFAETDDPETCLCGHNPILECCQ